MSDIKEFVSKAKEAIDKIAAENESKEALHPKEYKPGDIYANTVLGYSQIIKVLDSLAEPGEGYWWCRECKEPVDPHQVTFEECHERCGRYVEWKEVIEEPKPEGAISEEWIEQAFKLLDVFLRDEGDDEELAQLQAARAEYAALIEERRVLKERLAEAELWEKATRMIAVQIGHNWNDACGLVCDTKEGCPKSPSDKCSDKIIEWALEQARRSEG